MAQMQKLMAYQSQESNELPNALQRNEPKEVISNIQKGLTQSIRNTPQNYIDAILAKEIEFVAINYCAANNETEIFEETLMEAIIFVKNQFGNIGPSEIKEAFKLAAAKKLDVELKSYYGKFSISTLGEVLSKYTEYRGTIVKQITQLSLPTASIKTEAEYTEISIQRITRLKTRIEEMEVKNAIEFVAVVDYEFLVKTGEIVLTPQEKRNLMQEAEQLYKSELYNNLHRSNEITKLNCRRLIAELENMSQNTKSEAEQTKQRIAVRAQRLAVVKYLKQITQNEKNTSDRN